MLWSLSEPGEKEEEEEEEGRVSGSSLSLPLSWSRLEVGGGGGADDGALVDDEIGFGRKYLVMSFGGLFGLMGRLMRWEDLGTGHLVVDVETVGFGEGRTLGLLWFVVDGFGERFLLRGEAIVVVDCVVLLLLDECFG